MRKCPCCNNDREESDFKSDPRCRYCNNARTKRYKKDNPQKVNNSNRIARYKKFGLTKEAYEKLLKDQGGKCAVCKKVETETDSKGKIRSLAVDHCHVTNRVRGLLCAACNKAEGLLEGDIQRILALVDYLKREYTL